MTLTPARPMRTKRIAVLLLVLGVGAALIYSVHRRSQQMVAAPAEEILALPSLIGEFSGKDVTLRERVYDILGTRNVIMRHYGRGDEPEILLYIIFDPQTHKSSDPPENCIQGEGLFISSKAKVELSALMGGRVEQFTANKLLVDAHGRKQIYLYWFLAGGQMLDNYADQRVKLIKSYLLGKPLSGGQVRISTYAVDADEQEALSRLREFIEELMPVLAPIIRSQ